LIISRGGLVLIISSVLLYIKLYYYINRSAVTLKKLNELRRKAELTYQELADRSGITKSYLWDIENNGNLPGIKIAYAISKALNSTIDVVFPDPNEYELKEVLLKVVRLKRS